MLRSVTVRNYKSIVENTVELGRINVFIGENGCGKSNLLEALVLGSCSLSGRVEYEDFYLRGVRLARASQMCSAFRDTEPDEKIQIDIGCVRPDIGAFSFECTYLAREAPGGEGFLGALLQLDFSSPDEAAANAQRISAQHLARPSWFSPDAEVDARDVALALLEEEFGKFAIYNLNVLALRGLEVTSRRSPLGLHGEGLDTLIARFNDADFGALSEGARCISWLDDIALDRADVKRYLGYKPGRSLSSLYFADRFMADDNNVFSAENANEGVLHVLFYLALFISPDTSKVVGIDNIETALNPMLCRNLMKTLSRLAKERGKQALITTHNPAVLDGLNLHDDDQRLFVVYRNGDGHTCTRRIRVKPQAGESLKLSELWMRGYLGGLPQGF